MIKRRRNLWAHIPEIASIRISLCHGQSHYALVRKQSSSTTLRPSICGKGLWVIVETMVRQALIYYSRGYCNNLDDCLVIGDQSTPPSASIGDTVFGTIELAATDKKRHCA